MSSGNAFIQPDTVRYDKSVRGRPFDLKEILGKQIPGEPAAEQGDPPDWVVSGEVTPDTVYYGIGKSSNSAAEADDQARLHFAQFVEVSVQSIATRQIAENKDRLEENYSYTSLVATNANLRSVKVTERYITEDSTYYSLIKYGKSAYHALVTQEIKVALAAEIRKQEIAHAAREALRADSLRHKLTMDSLALSRKQAVIDSLDCILQMDLARQQQREEYIRLFRRKYASFLEISPRYQLIDVPSAAIPQTWLFASGRWNPQTGDIRQVQLGLSAWLTSLEVSLWAQHSLVRQGELLLKLQVMPEQGRLYPVSLALGWVAYVDAFSGEDPLDLRYPDSWSDFDEYIRRIRDRQTPAGSGFTAMGTLGIPRLSQHLSLYLESRRLSFASVWYPFPDNLGDALSIINQFDLIRHAANRNRFGDRLQWQAAIRIIAIPDRFATMLSYEDHEIWRINFEFQY